MTWSYASSSSPCKRWSLLDATGLGMVILAGASATNEHIHSRQLLNCPRAIWYPLQRAKKFQTLPPEHQKKILAEHGTLAHRYGAGGHAADVRLACHGLDKNDNDFIIGLLGPKLHPLSAIVQEMRKTEQTSQYLDSLGPFFVGKAAWQSVGVVSDTAGV